MHEKDNPKWERSKTLNKNIALKLQYYCDAENSDEPRKFQPSILQNVFTNIYYKTNNSFQIIKNLSVEKETLSTLKVSNYCGSPFSELKN